MGREEMEELVRAIRAHSGMSKREIREAAEHGADSGFPGFTYTTDGAEFYRANDRLIDELLSETAEEMGYANVGELVATFSRADMTDTRDGHDCLLSWFALEEAGRWLEAEREERKYRARYGV